MISKQERKQKRIKRIRKKLFGTALKPRIAVFRSNKHVYAQAINDETGETLAGQSDTTIKSKSKNKTDCAKEVGATLAKQLKAKKVTEGVFDRSGNAFHGRVKSVAEGLREGGINI